MAPFAKDSESAAVTPAPSAPATPAAKAVETAPAHPQPVALELPVTVNGARTIEGSDKREPFSETTKTVLVFNNGAVLRLASAVAPGQLLFLTNEKTKKEVVCLVVKSKNYRTVTGYVELEFTEPAAGFWGMRFSTDRITPVQAPSAARPAAPFAPGAPKVVPLAPPAALKPVAPIAPPAPVVPITTPVLPSQHVPMAPSTKPVEPIFAAIPAPLAPPPPPPSVAPVIPPAPVAVTTPSVAEVSAASFVPPPAPSNRAANSSVVKAPPVSEKKSAPTAPLAAESSFEELKLQAARLQAQLSTLLFSDAPAAKAKTPVAPTPVPPLQIPAAEAAAKILELAKADLQPPPPAEPKPALPVSKPASTLLKELPTSLVVEEVKTPAWLGGAPAVRTAPFVVEQNKVPSWLAPISGHVPSAVTEAPAPTPPPVLAEPAPIVIQTPEESFAVEVEETSETSESVVFDGQMLGESSSSAELSESGSKKGLLIGIAAAVLLLAGGFWYSRHLSAAKPAAVKVTNTPSPDVTVSVPRTEVAATSIDSSPTPSRVSTPAPTLAPSKPPSNATPPVSTATLVVPTPAPKTAITAEHITPPPEPKKPLAAGHLATPKISRGGHGANGSEAEPAVEANQVPSQSVSLEDLAASHSPAPVAPVPVGGDVKQAKLIKSVPPIYPAMAKTQHVAGDVKIDALIDEEGNVSTMKVLSGPALLHQPALTAVKQWKYSPAQLDGKPTAMHLTVIVQFRFQ